MADLQVNVRGDGSGGAGAMKQVGDASRETAGYLETFRKHLNEAAEKMFSFDQLARRATDAILDFGKEAVRAVFEFGKESLKAYGESEKAVRQLERAAGENTQAFREQAGAMRDQLGVSDELVMQVQKMLVTFGEAPAGIEHTTRAILDYAAYSGTDAVSATHALLSATQSGKTAFKELGLEYQKTGNAADDLDHITEALTKKIGGTAAAEADTLEGSVRKAKEQVGELQESIGKLISEMLGKTNAVNTFTGVINDLNEALTGDKARKSEEHFKKLHDAQEGVRVATESVAEEQTRLIDLISSKAPPEAIQTQIDFVEGLKKSLAGATDAYNELAKGGDKAKLSTKGENRKTGSGKEQKSEEEKEAERNYKTMQEWYDKDSELDDHNRAEKIKSQREYWDDVLKTQQEGQTKTMAEEDKAREADAKEYEEQWKEIQKQHQKEEDELRSHLKKLSDAAVEESRKMKAELATAGQQIGQAFVSTLAAALQEAMDGGEVDVIGMVADIGFAVASIAAQTVATIYGNPALGQLLGSTISAAGSLVHHERSKAWKQEQAAKKHDGGWIESFHGGGWPGLSSEEQMIIAKKGERVLSPEDVSRMGGPQAVDSAARGGKSGGDTYVIQAIDSASFLDAFQGRGGRAFYNATRTGQGSLSPLFNF